MMQLRPKGLGVLALLALAGATALIREPGDAASAYGGASTIYQAQLVASAGPAASDLLPGTGDLPSAVRPGEPHARRPRLVAGIGPFDLRGKPTISPRLIDQILAGYGSPMSGEGKALYKLGLKYGIDPAYCLAFFVHESGAGTQGEAVLTHNLGNIRAVSGQPSLDGYRYYDTWLEGAEDWYRLIRDLYIKGWGLTTVKRIIPVYAPSGDNNDPAAYIDDVEQLVTAWRAQS